MASFTDVFAWNGGVRLAVRDWGGPGHGLILIHGLSRTLVDWSVIAPMLAKTHRVVAMDVRGHGQSADGRWSWAAAIEDVDAIAGALRLEAPAVMGHSLGGMIASFWGRAHPGAAGVVNLDGHGNPQLDQYLGLDSDWVKTKRAELDALQRQQLTALSGPLSAERLATLESQQRALASQFGVPEEMFIEGLHRGTTIDERGTYLRPAIDGLGEEIYASLDHLDMRDVYRTVRCPLLLVGAVDPPGGRSSPPGLAWITELSSAFRRGQTRDLSALAANHANIKFETVEGTHGLLFEQATAITQKAPQFLRAS